MKKLWWFVLVSMLFVAGCAGLKGKAVNTGGMIYGGKVTMSDTSSMVPTLYIGVGSWWVHTIPMLAGQEYYVRHTYTSFWTGNEIGETEIYVGKFDGPGKLKVSKDEFGDLKVEVTIDE